MPATTDETFHKKQSPGMIVHDSATGDIYVVAKDGTPGQDFRAYQRANKIRDTQSTVRNRGRMRWIAVLIAGLLITGCAGFHFLVRNRSRS